MSENTESLLKRIIQLELDISKDCAENCKYISELFQYLEPNRQLHQSVRLKCLHTIRRILPIVFQTFQVNPFSQETETQGEKCVQQVEKWLRKQTTKLCIYLEELCVSCEEQVAYCAFLIGTTISAQFSVWHPLFERQVKRILVSNVEKKDEREEWKNFVENIFSVYGDVVLYTLEAISSLQPLEEATTMVENIELVVLCRIYELLFKGAQLLPKFISNSNRLEEKVSLGLTISIGEDVFRKRLRKTFTDAYLSFLSRKLPEQLEFRILQDLGSNIIPWLTRPLLLVDHLSSLTEQRGIISIMALDALFVLIRDYGLDYPSFYDKLYSLLTVRNLTAAQKFLSFMSKLLLSSLNISEHMVMSFVKKLVRLATRLPPVPCKWCLTCAIHLMLKYPSLACLVHRTTDQHSVAPFAFNSTESDSSKNTTEFLSATKTFVSKDPFDEFQADCEASHVASSCLWELQLIQHHYIKTVREQFQYFETDWGLQRMKRKASSLPPKPEDILETDITEWMEQPKKRKNICDSIWQSNLPCLPLDFSSQ
ncbi:hypothetical protein GpartN1_g3347.t1 [Galdieria partita]|uniref:CCAAT-binding factor domain-containing protein n=1 Tax=Galdieria partita TaxID=83374 RepID=A0A9C7PW22_9RHOD|nr:hypothetical protein GpartN1_g3347.t1 [Galdieria partita]